MFSLKFLVHAYRNSRITGLRKHAFQNIPQTPQLNPLNHKTYMGTVDYYSTSRGTPSAMDSRIFWPSSRFLLLYPGKNIQTP